jgi:hypothetical protein
VWASTVHLVVAIMRDDYFFVTHLKFLFKYDISYLWLTQL